MFRFVQLRAFFAVAVVVAITGTIWLQQNEIDSKDREIKSLEANITQCQSRVESKSFESKWANEFNSAWTKELEISTQNESMPKGGKDEKSNVTSNRSTFYDSF